MDSVKVKRECGQKWKTEVQAARSHTRDQRHAQTKTHTHWQFGESDCTSMQLLALLTASTVFMTWVQKKPPSPQTSAFGVVERTDLTAPYQTPHTMVSRSLNKDSRVLCSVFLPLLSSLAQNTECSSPADLLTPLLKNICKRWDVSRLAYEVPSNIFFFSLIQWFSKCALC